MTDVRCEWCRDALGDFDDPKTGKACCVACWIKRAVEAEEAGDVAGYVRNLGEMQKERDDERALTARLKRMVFVLCGDLLKLTSVQRFLPDIQAVYEEYKREQESGT